MAACYLWSRIPRTPSNGGLLGLLSHDGSKTLAFRRGWFTPVVLIRTSRRLREWIGMRASASVREIVVGHGKYGAGDWRGAKKRCLQKPSRSIIVAGRGLCQSVDVG